MATEIPAVEITYVCTEPTCDERHTVTLQELSNEVGWEYGIEDNVFHFSKDQQGTVLKITVEGVTVYEKTH